MSAPDDDIVAIVERTRHEQGLPPRIVDPTTLNRVAGLVRLDEALESTTENAVEAA